MDGDRLCGRERLDMPPRVSSSPSVRSTIARLNPEPLQMVGIEGKHVPFSSACMTVAVLGDHEHRVPSLSHPLDLRVVEEHDLVRVVLDRGSPMRSCIVGEPPRRNVSRLNWERHTVATFTEGRSRLVDPVGRGERRPHP